MTSKKARKIAAKQQLASETFLEEYLVRFTNGSEALVHVRVRHGVNEKRNHEQAARIAKEKFPNLEILTTCYC